MGHVHRGKFRVFVGNTQEISRVELSEKFGEFGKVIEVDLKGAYGFVGYDEEDEAKLAVSSMDRVEFKGRQLNVEISGGRPKNSNHRNGKDTTKLHVSGIGMNADISQLKEIFSEYGDVHDIHPMPGKDICFVHIDEKSAEHALLGATGKPFGNGTVKVEYGSLSKKPIYDRNSRKIVLHVANLPDVSLDHPDVLRKKFDLFGSVEDAQVIKSKHIAFIKIDERYADRAVETVNNSYFFGKQIKVQFSNKNPHGGSNTSQRDSLPSGLSGINADVSSMKNLDHSRFVIDDFFQLSGQRPAGVLLPRSSDVDSLLARRKRLETIHPYERTLLTYTADSRDFPPPPPEFLRLIRDRADIKAQLLLYQADQDGKLNQLAREADEYGFNSRPRSPYRSSIPERERHSYDRDPYPSSRYSDSQRQNYDSYKTAAYKTEPTGSDYRNSDSNYEKRSSGSYSSGSYPARY